ncbi:MAG: hypothetical protein IPF66_16325 [Holophagales bacterium]|nr:hypothetical protein [Holophagales bacterium]
MKDCSATTLNDAPLLEPGDEPVMVGREPVAGAATETVNAALEAPAGTVTVDGTTTSAEDDKRSRGSLLSGPHTRARRCRSGTLPGRPGAESESQAMLTSTGYIVKAAETDEPAAEAVMVAVVSTSTREATTSKVPVVALCYGTKGTTAAGLLLERLTDAPPAGAGRSIVTVPVAT